MKLEQISETKNYELGIRYRKGKVRVTYGNKSIDIYQTEENENGLQLTPITPWSGVTLFVKNMKQAKQKVEERVIRAFRMGNKDAKNVGKKLGMWK